MFMMAKTETPKSERRTQRRLVTRLPVEVRNPSGTPERQAHTRDVSTSGIFLYTQSRMVEGAEVELVLILPPELTSGQKCWVCCHAQVVRVEPGTGSQFGVAAEIKRMNLLPEIPV